MGVFDNLPGPIGGGSDEEDEADDEAAEEAPTDLGAMAPPDFREHAGDLAGRSDVPTLDFTVPSLEALDSLIDGPTSPVQDPVAYGSYLGETLVRSYDGRWVREGGDPVVAVPLPDDQTTVDVFGAAEMALERGPVFADVAGRLDEQGADRRAPEDVEPVEQESFADGARAAVAGAGGDDAASATAADDADPEPGEAGSTDTESEAAADDRSGEADEAPDDEPLATEPTEGWGADAEDADDSVASAADADDSEDAATAETPVEPAEDGDAADEADEAGEPTPLEPAEAGESTDAPADAEDETATESPDVTATEAAEPADATESTPDETPATSDDGAESDADDGGATDADATEPEDTATATDADDGGESPGPPEWATHGGGRDWAPPAPDEGDDADEPDATGPDAAAEGSDTAEPGPAAGDASTGPTDDADATDDATEAGGLGGENPFASAGDHGYSPAEAGSDEGSAGTEGEEPTADGMAPAGDATTTESDETTTPVPDSPPPRRTLSDAAHAFADRWDDREFDLSPASLQGLDHFIAEQWDGRFDTDSFDPPVVDLEAAPDPLVRVAAYFGTVVVRTLPADWARDDAGEPAVEVTGRGEESRVVPVMAIAREALVDRPIFRYHYDAVVTELGLDAPAASDAARTVFDVPPDTPSAEVVPDILEAAEDYATDWERYGLDYSPASLTDLDTLVAREFDADAFANATLGEAADVDSLLLTAQATGSGAYFAAVCVRHLDAQWLVTDDVLLTIEGPDGERRVDPLEVAESVLRGSRSFEDHYAWLAERVGLA